MPKVKLFGNLRNAAGSKLISIEGSSIHQVVFGVATLYPATAIYLTENGQIRPKVIITINGQTINDMDMQLTEQDEMAIFPPIGGG